MAPPPEPLLTYMMPLYAGVSYVGILTVPDPDLVLLPVSLFGAAWALRNTMVGSNFDLGVVTMGLVAGTEALDIFVWKGSKPNIKYALAVECVLVAVNFCIPFLIWKDLEKALAKTKSIFWFKVFKVYLAAMAVYFLYAAHKVYAKDRSRDAYSRV